MVRAQQLNTPAQHFAGDRGTGACLACACRSAPPGIAPTEYGRALLGLAMCLDDLLGVRRSSFADRHWRGSEAIYRRTLLLPSSNGSPGVIRDRVSSRTSDETDILYRELSGATSIDCAERGALAMSNLDSDSIRSFIGRHGGPEAHGPQALHRSAELVNEPWVLPPPEGIMGPAYLEVSAPAVSTILA
jgi:hypothetical protein